MKKSMTSAQETMRAAMLSRRSLMKSALALGAVGFAAPIYSKHAMADGGELNYMGWAGYDYKPVIEPFSKATGIKVNFTEQPDNDTIFAQAKLALQTGAFDVVEPTVDRVKSYVENDIVQPWDEAKANLDGYLPGMADGLAGEMAKIDGKRYFLPGVWGTEALVFNKDEKPEVYGTASLADLFDDAMEGKVTVRAHSALAA
jgi:spermidine/putrescine transport system substrate-binding protein